MTEDSGRVGLVLRRSYFFVPGLGTYSSTLIQPDTSLNVPFGRCAPGGNNEKQHREATQAGDYLRVPAWILPHRVIPHANHEKAGVTLIAPAVLYVRELRALYAGRKQKKQGKPSG